MFIPYFRYRPYGPCPRCESWVTAKDERCAACDYLLTERDKVAIDEHAKEQRRRGRTFGFIFFSALVVAALIASQF